MSDRVAVGQAPLYNYVMREGSIVHQVSDSIFDRSELALNAYKEIQLLNDPKLNEAAERYYVFHCLSVLRSVDLGSISQVEAAKAIRKDVIAHRRNVLSSVRTPTRDKIALFALTFGLPFYRFAWDLYAKGTGRI